MLAGQGCQGEWEYWQGAGVGMMKGFWDQLIQKLTALAWLCYQNDQNRHRKSKEFVNVASP